MIGSCDGTGTSDVQCEDCPAGSKDPDCKYTKDACNAICAAPHSKCNYETKKCESCDFGVDPKCTQTSGQCNAPGVCADNTFVPDEFCRGKFGHLVSEVKVC